jgi:hypothetical protein
MSNYRRQNEKASERVITRQAYLFAIIWLVIATTSVNAQAVSKHIETADECAKLTNEPPNIKLGVNRTNLGRVQDFKSILKNMSQAGVHNVRLTLDEPFQTTIRSLAEATKLGMDVLLNVPTWLPDYAMGGAFPRKAPAGSDFYDILGLSQIDVSRYRSRFAQLLSEIETAGGRISTFEIGNEINAAGFNGDLPLGVLPGQLITADNFNRNPNRQKIEIGFQKYAAIISATREVLLNSQFHKTSKIISAGLTGSGASPKEIASKGIWIIEFGLVLDLFRKYHVLENVDSIAVHLYPSVSATNRVTQFKQIFDALERATRICARAEIEKPSLTCSITEWGFKASGNACTMNDMKRLQETQDFSSATACLARARNITASYLFDWDKSPEYSIWRCHRLLQGGRVLLAN